ncbi:MAG: hypothetical protein Q8862_14705 [Bacteroidota bacterium]|nr:hypothetical protein [Bacteroidota bacterium]
MVSFIFYPNETFNKNKRIKALYPAMGALLIVLGGVSMIEGNLITGLSIVLGGLTFITVTLVYSLPTFKYSSYYLVDNKIISYKKNIFSPANEIFWKDVKQVSLGETHARLTLKNERSIEVRPDMLGYHELQLFLDSVFENAGENEVPVSQQA